MKIMFWVLLLVVFGLFVSSSCHKNSERNIHVVNLLDKSLDEIRAEIAGTWKVQYDSSNGIAGPQKGIPMNGNYEIFSFLPNDTVKINKNGTILVYEKATISKEPSFSYPFEVYIYRFGGGAFAWTMDQKRNDTLVIEAGFLSGGGLRYFCTRQ
jgi:hypothetical protein